MKAIFDEPQESVKIIEDGDKIYAFIAVNGEWVDRKYAEDLPEKRCWECDWREIVTTKDKIDVDALRKEPEKFLEWREPKEKSMEERLARAEENSAAIRIILLGEEK